MRGWLKPGEEMMVRMVAPSYGCGVPCVYQGGVDRLSSRQLNPQPARAASQLTMTFRLFVCDNNNMPGESFYFSPEWRALRAAVLRRDGYRCVVCGADVSGRGRARVDHIRRVKDGGALLDPSNCRTLCPTHDAQGHREKGTGTRRRDERFAITGCTPSGKPLNPAHPWNR